MRLSPFVAAPLVAAALVAAPVEAQSDPRSPIDTAALGRLRRAAAAAHSDALVVWRDGRPVVAWYAGGAPARIAAMSMTKSVVNLAVGRLVTTGAIRSLDEPVSRFYPEWRRGPKAAVTLRHLLGHTSGLRDPGDASDVERSPDAVRLALDAPLTDAPGTRFAYNNTAVNLLSGIVQKASGKRMDVYVRDEIFTPMGITDVRWALDSAGNALAYAGLEIRADDVAKLGQLVLDRGRWAGRELIAPAWFDESFRASALNPRGGLLWWLVPERTTWVVDDARLDALRRAGADTAFLRRAAGIRGRYPSVDAYMTALRRGFGEKFWEPVGAGLAPARESQLARPEYGPMVGVEANGYRGQYLVVYPDRRLVAVRMIRAFDGFDPVRDSFESFRDFVRALVPPTPGTTGTAGDGR